MSSKSNNSVITDPTKMDKTATFFLFLSFVLAIVGIILIYSIAGIYAGIICIVSAVISLIISAVIIIILIFFRKGFKNQSKLGKFNIFLCGISLITVGILIGVTYNKPSENNIPVPSNDSITEPQT